MIRILLSKKLGEIRMTQATLSRITGIRPNTINDLYHELTDRVSLSQLEQICEALDCELDELVVWEKVKRTPMCLRSEYHWRELQLRPKQKEGALPSTLLFL